MKILSNLIGCYMILNSVVWYSFYGDPIFSILIGMIGLCIVVVSLIYFNI